MPFLHIPVWNVEMLSIHIHESDCEGHMWDGATRQQMPGSLLSIREWSPHTCPKTAISILFYKRKLNFYLVSDP